MCGVGYGYGGGGVYLGGVWGRGQGWNGGEREGAAISVRLYVWVWTCLWTPGRGHGCSVCFFLCVCCAF